MWYIKETEILVAEQGKECNGVGIPIGLGLGVQYHQTAITSAFSNESIIVHIYGTGIMVRCPVERNIKVKRSNQALLRLKRQLNSIVLKGIIDYVHPNAISMLLIDLNAKLSVSMSNCVLILQPNEDRWPYDHP